MSACTVPLVSDNYSAGVCPSRASHGRSALWFSTHVAVVRSACSIEAKLWSQTPTSFKVPETRAATPLCSAAPSAGRAARPTAEALAQTGAIHCK
jgi:hypothetical protein